MTLGIGRAIKRDAVLIKIVTDEGHVGWGEAHAGRAPGALAQLASTTLKTLILGMDAADVVGVWDRVYKMQLASHGMGAAAAIALSGIDMALWDIRGKAVGWPLYRLLGAGAKAVPAYGGGVSLGYQPPEQLAAEAKAVTDAGYRALKLRLGDNPRDDIARVHAVRKALGDEIDILTDANAAYFPRRRAPGDAGARRRRRRLARGTLPATRLSALPRGAQLRAHAAGGW